MTFTELFPFDYLGGGWFRMTGVPRGTPAPMLHGKDASLFVYHRALDPSLSVRNVFELLNLNTRNFPE